MSAVPVVVQLCVSGLWVRISVIHIITCLWILRGKMQTTEQECCSSHYKNAMLSFHNPSRESKKENLAKRREISSWRNRFLYGIRSIKPCTYVH